jgi:hypothetical protein
MTARQPRRPRRRSAAPAATLPRPASGGAAPTGSTSPARIPASARHHREHHVTTDYSYVRKDLVVIGAVGAVVLAFIVAMSFVL